MKENEGSQGPRERSGEVGLAGVAREDKAGSRWESGRQAVPEDIRG